MEVDKLKQWLDVAQQFQSEQFWNQIFDEKKSNDPGNGLSINPLTIKEFVPKCDLFENGRELVVEAEIPGLKKEDLRISIQKQLLTITGEFKTLHSQCKYYLKERMNRKFKKELTLPYPVYTQKIRTEISNGILWIIMPFQHEEAEDIPITFQSESSN